MAMGDFTGSGSMQLAITDGQRVYIYDLAKEGIKQIGKYDGAASDNVIALDAADINDNGVAELFVTNFTADNGLRSYVLEYRGGKFVKILEDVPLHFRVLEGADGTPRLYAQGGTLDKPFDGPVRRYTWVGNKYVPAEVVPLPKQSNIIYGFTLADLDGTGAPKIVLLDGHDYLRVYDRGGTEIYRSSDHYGGTEQVLEAWPEGGRQGSFVDFQPTRMYVQGRLYFGDILGNGKKQLIVPRNTPSTGYAFKTRLYDKGKIFGLSWDGMAMQDVRETRELPGYIADYALVDPDGSGDRRLVLLVVQTNLLGMEKSRSMVIMLALKPQG